MLERIASIRHMLEDDFIGLLWQVGSYPPLRKLLFPKYRYNVTASQLCFLCRCIDETRCIEGSIAEVGCYMGATTVFLNKYMDAENIEKPYYAIDTFRGFTVEDIGQEISAREIKQRGFRLNKKKWFDGTMQDNGIHRVRSIEADVNEWDLTTLGHLSFAFIDLDLYRPIKKSLRQLYSLLGRSGIMLVHDCEPQGPCDGAPKAYYEFMNEIGHSPEVLCGMGMIRKPA